MQPSPMSDKSNASEVKLPDIYSREIRAGLLALEAARRERKAGALDCLHNAYDLIAGRWLVIQGTLTQADLYDRILAQVLEPAVEYGWIPDPRMRPVRRRRTFPDSWIPGAPVIDWVWQPIPESQLVDQFGRFKVPNTFRSWFLGHLGGRIAYWESKTLLHEPLREKETVQSRVSADALQTVRETASLQNQNPMSVPASKRKPGPKTDREAARRLRNIVQRIAASGSLNKKLKEVCEALDEDKIPCPRPWKDKDIPTWADAEASDRDLAIKAIKHRLKIARN